MNPLNVISRAGIDELLSKRAGETKLGETVRVVDAANWQQALKESDATFIILGIPEDIGVRANYGVGGTQGFWLPALKAILNVQETGTLQGNKIAILGAFDFDNLTAQSESAKDIHALREMVSTVDAAVYPVIETIVSAGKIPIVIGGGHNNAYPILKGVSKGMGMPVNCINLDAHSDYRPIEGRHSGNGFRYAKMDGYLKKYAIIGLHESYNSQQVLAEMMSDKDISFCFYEDMFLHHKADFHSSIENAIRFTSGSPAGIEIDLDCIEHALSSATTPCGLSALQARQFLVTTARLADTAYLHITEGAVQLSDGRESKTTPKLAAYLVTDFIRACTNKQTVFIQESEL